jgi:hypothetical protein
VEETNSFVYVLPQAQAWAQGQMEVSLSSMSLYNAFFNVSSKHANTSVTIEWPSGATDWESTTVELDPAFYDAAALSAKIKQICYDNAWFSTSNGVNLIYMAVGTSTYEYKNTITTYEVPSDAVPPSGATWVQTTGGRAPRITLSVGLGAIIGFSAGVYGEEGGTYKSDLIPQVDQESSILVCAPTLVHSGGLSAVSSLIYSMAKNAAFGSLMTSPAHESVWFDIRPGQYQEITIELYGNNLTRLELQDTNIMLVLSLRRKRKQNLR